MTAVRAPASGHASPEKRILCFGASRARFEALTAAMAKGSGGLLGRSLGHPTVALGDALFRFLPTYDVDGARDVLAERYVSLVLVDLCDAETSEQRCAAAKRLVRALDATEDRELRYGFHRILVLLPKDADADFDELLVELGRLGIRNVLRVDHDGVRPSAATGARVLRRIEALVEDRDPGTTALVANGGGITGIYFELGALKCLDDCLGPGGVNAFDAFYGISAGAVVTSMLAVGYSVDEILAAVAGHEGGRIPRLSLSLLRFGHLNLRDTAWRWRRMAQSGASATLKAFRGGGRGVADDLFLEWTSLVGAPFHSDGFEKMLRELLDVPHGTNRFDELPRKLYIGATDQDARRPVLFGAPGYDRVPISRAVQASLSINPAFAGVRIGDRFYEDGAVTRTSNFVEAIEHGAKLVVVLDPFVPYVSKKAGHNNHRGMLYNLDQDIRTMSFTRFEGVRDRVLREHPEVSSYTFLPANSQRKLLSMNPMDHRPYLAIWRAAYLSTLKRVRQLAHRLAGDLAVRGRSLDLARASEVEKRLLGRGRIGLADFYPDGKVVLHQRPLVREGVASPLAAGRVVHA